MKIAVNTRLLRQERMTGIELFTFETMSRIAASHPEHTFYYIFDRPYNKKFITSENIIPVVTFCKSRYRAVLLKFWFEYVLPVTVRKIKPDVMIYPDSLMSLKLKIPSLLVIHDIGFEHYPGHLPSQISKYYRKYTPLFVHKAQRIATVSQFSGNDLIDHYGANASLIDVVFNGANTNFRKFNESEKNEVRQIYTNGCPYFLFVGTIHPRKNLANQLIAYDTFRRRFPGARDKFLVVGDRWIWNSELEDAWSAMNFKDDVVFAGRLNSDQLGRVISSATALMYVSFFEGFGIPILEAFYAETPVITANVSSMPEIAADAALCVDPADPEAIAEAMIRIVNEPELVENLVAAGCRRKAEFSWDKTATKLWQSIEVLTEQSGPHKIE